VLASALSIDVKEDGCTDLCNKQLLKAALASFAFTSTIEMMTRQRRLGDPFKLAGLVLKNHSHGSVNGLWVREPYDHANRSVFSAAGKYIYFRPSVVSKEEEEEEKYGSKSKCGGLFEKKKERKEYTYNIKAFIVLNTIFKLLLYLLSHHFLYCLIHIHDIYICKPLINRQGTEGTIVNTSRRRRRRWSWWCSRSSWYEKQDSLFLK
jgi:hypothetical protein